MALAHALNSPAVPSTAERTGYVCSIAIAAAAACRGRLHRIKRHLIPMSFPEHKDNILYSFLKKEHLIFRKHKEARSFATRKISCPPVSTFHYLKFHLEERERGRDGMGDVAATWLELVVLLGFLPWLAPPWGHPWCSCSTEALSYWRFVLAQRIYWTFLSFPHRLQTKCCSNLSPFAERLLHRLAARLGMSHWDFSTGPCSSGGIECDCSFLNNTVCHVTKMYLKLTDLAIFLLF